LQAGDRNAVAHAESRGLELAIGLALPATLGLIALGEPVVRMLFEHGAFTASDTAATSRALTWLALGLPAHVLVKALSPAFFARSDTLTPMWAMLKGFAVTLVLAVVLGRLFGTQGIAAGIALGAWSSALSLIRHGTNTFGFLIDVLAWRRLPRIAAAALLMGGVLGFMAARLLPEGTGSHGLAQAALVLGVVAAGIAVYGLLLALFGVTNWTEAVNAIRQTGASDLRD
jgi:putative peptidoglycan lipid II flippase